MPVFKVFGKKGKDDKGAGKKEKEPSKKDSGKSGSKNKVEAGPSSSGSGSPPPASAINTSKSGSNPKLAIATKQASRAGGLATSGSASGGTSARGKEGGNSGRDVPFHQYTAPPFTTPLQFVDHTVHCFAAFFMSFKYPSMTTLQFFFSLFNKNLNRFVTEEVLSTITIVEQVKYQAEESKLVEGPKRGSIFKDLVKADVDGKAVYLVCRMVRVGKLQIEDQEVDGLRVPVGWGILSLKDAIGGADEDKEISAFAYVDEAGTLSKSKRKPMEEELPTVTMKVYEKPYKDAVEGFLQTIISATEKNDMAGFVQEAEVSLACRLDPLPNEHVHLGLLKRVGKHAAVAERTTTFVHTTSSQAFAKPRDELYCTLSHAEFPEVIEHSYAIITMSVRQFSGQAVNCIMMGRRGELVSDATFTTEKHPYHKPQLQEPVIISLAELSNQTLHLFFQIQLFPQPDYVGAGQHLNAFLKLSTDGKFLKDGDYKLKCFTRAPGTNRMDAVYYLKSGATKSVSNGVDFITVRTSLGSSRHTQNADLNALLSWQVYPPNMLGSYIKKISGGKLKDGDIFRVFPELMSNLFEVIFSPKHGGVTDQAKEAMYHLVDRCLTKRTKGDADIQIAGLSDFACLLGYYFLSVDNSLPDDRIEVCLSIYFSLVPRN